MTPVQPTQNQPLQSIQQRPQRVFNEGAAGTAGRVMGIVLTILTAIVTFLTLPWAAALAITGGVGLLSLLCCNCCPQNPQRTVIFPAADIPLGSQPIIPASQLFAPAPGPRWYHRAMPFFFPNQRGVPVADPRPREYVGIGQYGYVNPTPTPPFRREVPPPNVGFRERTRDRGVYHDRPPLTRMGGRAERESVGLDGGGRREPFFRAPGPEMGFALPPVRPPEMGFAPPPARAMGGLSGGVEREAVGVAGGGRRG